MLKFILTCKHKTHWLLLLFIFYDYNTILCEHHHDLIPDYFLQPKRNILGIPKTRETAWGWGEGGSIPSTAYISLSTTKNRPWECWVKSLPKSTPNPSHPLATIHLLFASMDLTIMGIYVNEIIHCVAICFWFLLLRIKFSNSWMSQLVPAAHSFL